MNLEDFQKTALSILAAHGEMNGPTLKNAIAKGKKKISDHFFCSVMADLKKNKYITKELRQASTEEQKHICGNRRVAYYAITPDGRKKHRNYAKRDPRAIGGVPNL